MRFTKKELATIQNIVANATITIKGKDTYTIVDILDKIKQGLGLEGKADGTTDA